MDRTLNEAISEDIEQANGLFEIGLMPKAKMRLLFAIARSALSIATSLASIAKSQAKIARKAETGFSIR